MAVAIQQIVVGRGHHGRALAVDGHAGDAVDRVGRLHGRPEVVAAALEAVLHIARHGAVHKAPLDLETAGRGARDGLEHRGREIQVAFGALWALVQDLHHLRGGLVRARVVDAGHLGTSAAVLHVVPLRGVDGRVVGGGEAER